ncbi:hypothetical protein Cgig2_013681 [Carnegiea gigantea]|uniref:Prolyl 4-hydroxylase alpha subunit domain-containing protein n=1 Tax=Carnegiea gigantea TaxID=171969 RepID=A0A9Q1KBX5_9CARY|nr:hypothetical protein Cgig2_013681 [Carnegiea gigantea]
MVTTAKVERNHRSYIAIFTSLSQHRRNRTNLEEQNNGAPEGRERQRGVACVVEWDLTDVSAAQVLEDYETAILAIEKRISVYSQVPVENGELIQVLRYERSQFYKPHHDYFSDEFNVKRGGQRIATMLMYLSDNVEGGETYFPLYLHALSGAVEINNPDREPQRIGSQPNSELERRSRIADPWAGSGECSCGGKIVQGISIKPVKGVAVLFWSMVSCNHCLDGKDMMNP